MRIAYITGIYPRPSDTFIRIEVQKLRAMGFAVETFSIRDPGADALINEEIREEARRTTYLMKGWGPLLKAAARAIFTEPLAFAGAMRQTFSTHPPGLSYRIKQFAYVCEALVLARKVRAMGIEHIHNHIGENSATVAMLASAIAGVPYSMTIHGPGIFFHPQAWALGEKIAQSQFTACISHFCRSQCMIFTPPQYWDKLKIVRCAVGDAFIDIQAKPIPQAPRFVFVGRLAEEKGALLLIEAIDRLKQAGTRVELKVIGDGPLREHMQQRIADSGLVDQIELLGWCSSDQVRSQIEQARCLVHASFAEGLPVVMMEALALGRPVIATRIAAVSELVEHGQSGWLVDASDLDGLIGAMQAAATCSAEQLEQMGRHGAGRVADRHHPDRNVERLAGLIKGSSTDGVDV